jgi:hypothetical protein
MPLNWLNKIRSHQVPPPQGAWMRIANELDKENETEAVDLKTKMYNYQSIPPSNVLANIFATLDKEETQPLTSFTERMYNYQQQAPTNAWKNIINQLDKSGAKIVPLANNKKNPKAIYFRMATAASVIAIIATTIWLSSRNTGTANQIVAVTPAIKQPITAEVKIKQSEIPANGVKQNTTLPAANPQEKKLTQEKTIAQTNVKTMAPLPVAVNIVPGYVKGNTTNDLANNPAAANNEKLQDINGNTPNDIALMNTPNSYISITGPDGQSIKVSAKFSNLINYLTDNNAGTKENIDVIISESAKWRKIFAGWREKMANNSVAPSIYNFMDIISLSEVLEKE